ncbi:hypothetical protein ACHAW5_001143 [Stephanodiscus triporus]|uniref:Uncharacterized protein n=1 Tax=Stephanodiscus triporus TaxID=2934178 RepID=A0ABD3QPU4_9STRA
MSNEGASGNRHDARDVAPASSPRRHADTTTTIEEVKERRASLVSRANDESMAAILLAVANAYDLEIIVNDDKNIVLRLKKPPAAPCSIAEITPIQERGAPYDVVSRNDDNKSTCDRIATTDESYNRRPIVAAYPIGCPVWFDVRESKSRSSTTRLVARAGMIKKSASFDACERIIEYEVETTGEQGTATTKRIDEGGIAYAVRCPVLVTRINDGGSTAEVVDHRDEDDNGISTSDAMVGEIIDVTPAIRNGVRTFLYSVLISTNDDGDDDEGGGGGVLIERDVVPERVRYRFSLEALQYSIREVTSSSNSSSRRGWKRKGLGIRSSGGQHEPMRNGVPPSVEAKTKKKMKETSTVSLGRINVSVDADDANDNLDALHALPQRLVAPPILHHPRDAARGTKHVPPPSLPTPSPRNYQHYQPRQGSAVLKPVTINATAEHQLDVPCTSKSEVADEWCKHHHLPQVSGKKAQMIFPDKLHLILSMPVYSHALDPFAAKTLQSLFPPLSYYKR